MADKTNKKSAFGLIETMIACGLLIMVFGATSTLNVLSTHGTVIAKHKTEAYNIAQGAMEKIKGARDWVWETWNEAGAGATWDKFWDDSSNIVGSDNEFSEIKSNLESNCVFIDHNTGALTEAACTTSPAPGLKFTRSVVKAAVNTTSWGVPSNNAYKVTVTVSWSDYGQTKSVSIVSYLTNWKPRY